MSVNGGLEPGSLHGGRGQEVSSEVDTDSQIISEVSRMSAAEFKKKYITGPEAVANMAAYTAAVERRKQ
jgi:hypothetical protein